MKQRELWVPADRFMAVVDAKGQPAVGKQSAIGRRLCELRAGRQTYLRLGTADKILVQLGLEAAWHVPKEQGGLADIYEDGVQYGRPNFVLPPSRKSYRTDEERREARRRTWREGKRRQRGVPVEVAA